MLVTLHILPSPNIFIEQLDAIREDCIVSITVYINCFDYNFVSTLESAVLCGGQASLLVLRYQFRFSGNFY